MNTEQQESKSIVIFDDDPCGEWLSKENYSACCYASREIVFKEKVAEWDIKYCPTIKDKINSVIEDAAKRGIPL